MFKTGGMMPSVGYCLIRGLVILYNGSISAI